MSKKVITPMQIIAADSNSRTISGRIVTFEETGNASIGKVQFAQGSIEPTSVLLNLEHDRTRRIGKTLSIYATKQGIDATFKIAETTAGNDALVEAQEGLRDGFSVEVMFDEYETMNDGTVRILKGELTGVALTSERPPNGGPNSTEVSGANCEIRAHPTFGNRVIYLSPNTTNTIVVTWTQRASSGDRYILRLTNIAKNATTDFTLLKSDNLSNYTNRYDRSTKTLLQKPIHQLRTATYKEEWDGGYMGFHTERGRGPKPLGGYWMKLETSRNASKDNKGPELQLHATFTPADRLY